MVHHQRTPDQRDILVSAFAALLLVLVVSITLGFVGKVRGVKMLICGLFSEPLDHYLSSSDHSLVDVECRQEAGSPKTGIAGAAVSLEHLC